jgi:hypothetical protein
VTFSSPLFPEYEAAVRAFNGDPCSANLLLAQEGSLSVYYAIRVGEPTGEGRIGRNHPRQNAGDQRIVGSKEEPERRSGNPRGTTPRETDRCLLGGNAAQLGCAHGLHRTSTGPWPSYQRGTLWHGATPSPDRLCPTVPGLPQRRQLQRRARPCPDAAAPPVHAGSLRFDHRSWAGSNRTCPDQPAYASNLRRQNGCPLPGCALLESKDSNGSEGSRSRRTARQTTVIQDCGRTVQDSAVRQLGGLVHPGRIAGGCCWPCARDAPGIRYGTTRHRGSVADRAFG